MPFARVQARLHRDSLLPEDESINTWHFVTPGDVAAAATAITDNLAAFYSAIQAQLSQVNTGSITYDFYDLEDPTPRVPVASTGSSFTPGGSAFPSECAITLSFQGVVVSGQNQARRRGRVFLGPLSQASGIVVGGDLFISPGVRTTICAAADALASDTTLPGLVWAVFSPTTAGAPPWSAPVLSEAFVTITNGWVDNAYDTIRSRGSEANARTVFN